MCGINGVFSYANASLPASRKEVIATRDYMAPRGPDGAGFWWSEDGRVALAHRRLAIIDLSDRAAQPMATTDGQLVITFNGEIYNFEALRTELEREGRTFYTTSDTEMLLHLYDVHGAEMVHRLRGMYAFAIWDAKRKGLLLVRDPYGIKPLYYSNDGWTYRFASQVKALRAGGCISDAPEPAGITGFHLFGSVPEPFTIYRDIRSLPAGHTQWIDSAGPREPRQFASLASAWTEGVASDAPRPDERYDIARASLLDSVRHHLVADVEVGVFLSAGVDSGALLGLMRDAGQGMVRALTLQFEEFRGTPDDEAPQAAAVAEWYGAQHVVRHVSEHEFRECLPRVIEAMDQPSIDGVNTWFVSKAARELGLKVAISGLGGDELLAGYPSFSDIPRWRRWFGPIANTPGLGKATRAIAGWAWPSLYRERPKALGMLEYAGSDAGAYLLRRALFLPFELADQLDPDMAREGMRRLEPLRRLQTSITPDPGRPIARVAALEAANYMRNQLLRDADWAGMAHSLEIRVPLVDYTLLRSLSPLCADLRPGEGKRILAHAPSKPLPSAIVDRAKTGFGVPTGAWTDNLVGTEQRVNGAHEPKGLASRRWSRFVLSNFQRSRGLAPA